MIENCNFMDFTCDYFRRANPLVRSKLIDWHLGLESAGRLARYREVKVKDFAEEDAAKSTGVSDREPNTKPAHDAFAAALRFGDLDVVKLHRAARVEVDDHPLRAKVARL